MQVTAKLNHFRMSPRKIRLVTDLIKGLDVTQAKSQLQFLTKGTAQPVLKLLNSAMANAKHNFEIEEDNLYIKEIRVDQGPTMKRWMPRAFGRVSPIMKRTSHITLILEEKISKKPKKKIKKPKRPEKLELVPTPEKKETVEELVPEQREKPERKFAVERRPYGATGVARKRFFSRQTFDKAKKFFRRKSV